MPIKANNPPSKGLLRIGKLAQLAGVSVPTVKHYLAEGLLPPPIKTGRTSAYYRPQCVDRIKLIKKLQREKYLPLEVIRRIIDLPPGDPQEIKDQAEIGGYLAGANPKTKGPLLSLTRAARNLGWPVERLRRMIDLGLIHPKGEPPKGSLDPADLELLSLGREREALGLPPDLNLKTLAAFGRALNGAVEEDIYQFMDHLLTGEDLKKAWQRIEAADELLDKFLVAYRRRRLNLVARRAVGQWNRLNENLSLLLPTIPPGRHLPRQPPRQTGFKLAWLFCRGDFQAVIDYTAEPGPARIGEPVLALLAQGRIDEALDRIKKLTNQASARPLDNLAGALACTSAAAARPGFIEPLSLAKPALEHLGLLENGLAASNPWPLSHFALAGLAGTVYSLLPGVFQVREKGLALIRKSLAGLKRHQDQPEWPDWLNLTWQQEIAPQLDRIFTGLLAAEPVPGAEANQSGPDDCFK